ncbi:unnamed protein product [Rhizophagus irregularis]|nr:unnamed protein product [Rhizophagus irregularis]
MKRIKVRLLGVSELFAEVQFTEAHFAEANFAEGMFYRNAIFPNRYFTEDHFAKAIPAKELEFEPVAQTGCKFGLFPTMIRFEPDT